jgi:DNA-binding winged helix-turn-helix (wHTH) protein
MPHLSPSTSWSVFFRNQYFQPAEREDVKIIFDAYKKRAGINLSTKLQDYFFELVNRYTQYLQLALIYLHEKGNLIKTRQDIYDGLINDERISFQSEELWETLEKAEQEILIKVASKELILAEDKRIGSYLWNTGFIKTKGVNNYIFSSLFEAFVKEKSTQNSAKEVSSEFTKKENILFNFLFENKDRICEREEIIEVVWPEEEDLGVSDWAVDKLIARVRNKLKTQNNNFEITTVKTRGYKLNEASLS